MDKETFFYQPWNPNRDFVEKPCFSYSKIVCKRTYETEDFVQEYSCEQIFDHSNRSICSVKEDFREFCNPKKSYNTFSSNLQYNPLSSQFDQLSLSEAKIDSQKNGKIDDINQSLDLTSLETRLKNLEQEPPKKKKMNLPLVLLFLIVSFTLCSAFFSLPSITVNFMKRSGYCHSSFKARFLPIKLKQQIYGQDDAVNKLSDIFNNVDRSDGIIVLSILGGIGVGKSHTSEIIRKEFKKQGYQVIDIADIHRSDEAYQSLSKCKCNLLRLDNLKADDVDVVANFISDITFKVREDGYKPCIVIVSIFNTEIVRDNLKRHIDLNQGIELLTSTFKNRNFEFTVLPYQTLSNEALLKCIREAALFANVELSADSIEKIKYDLINANSGCKGAYAKVQIEGKPRGKQSKQYQKTEL